MSQNVLIFTQQQQQQQQFLFPQPLNIYSTWIEKHKYKHNYSGWKPEINKMAYNLVCFSEPFNILLVKVIKIWRLHFVYIDYFEGKEINNIYSWEGK